MNKKMWLWTSATLASVVGFTLTMGCNPSGSTVSNANQSHSDTSKVASPETASTKTSSGTPMSSASATNESEHGHMAGAHGGIMVSLGRDSYHVEAVVDSTGAVLLYTLGKDETRVIDVESQTLKGFIKPDGAVDSQSITFDPSPQDGDSKDKTSLFVGKLPTELIGRKLDVTIPNIRIDGERFRLGFQTGQDPHGESPKMPDKLADNAERELYLTPGGRYTASDIAANGTVTASQKFKGIKSAHNMNPKVGERICPITQTLANPAFTWVIDGKPYLFCCPPCVDEFVKMAKASTEALADPESFVKK